MGPSVKPALELINPNSAFANISRAQNNSILYNSPNTTIDVNLLQIINEGINNIVKNIKSNLGNSTIDSIANTTSILEIFNGISTSLNIIQEGTINKYTNIDNTQANYEITKNPEIKPVVDDLKTIVLDVEGKKNDALAKELLINKYTITNLDDIKTLNNANIKHKPEPSTATEIQQRLNNCQNLEMLYLIKHNELMTTFQFTINLFNKYKYVIDLLMHILQNLVTKTGINKNCEDIKLPINIIENLPALLKDQKDVLDVINKMKLSMNEPNLVNLVGEFKSNVNDVPVSVPVPVSAAVKVAVVPNPVVPVSAVVNVVPAPVPVAAPVPVYNDLITKIYNQQGIFDTDKPDDNPDIYRKFVENYKNNMPPISGVYLEVTFPKPKFFCPSDANISGAVKCNTYGIPTIEIAMLYLLDFRVSPNLIKITLEVFNIMCSIKISKHKTPSMLFDFTSLYLKYFYASIIMFSEAANSLNIENKFNIWLQLLNYIGNPFIYGEGNSYLVNIKYDLKSAAFTKDKEIIQTCITQFSQNAEGKQFLAHTDNNELQKHSYLATLQQNLMDAEKTFLYYNNHEDL